MGWVHMCGTLSQMKALSLGFPNLNRECISEHDNNTGGSQFKLQNGGQGTCALAFRNELVTIGGKDGQTHGKVDR